MFLLINALILGLFVSFNLISGNKPYVISSDSMSPMLNEGDIIFVKKSAFENLKIDNIITFRQPNSNITVTHRIVGIDPEAKNVITRGDNLGTPDSEQVNFSEIVGVYVYKISTVGNVIKKNS